MTYFTGILTLNAQKKGKEKRTRARDRNRETIIERLNGSWKRSLENEFRLFW